MKIMIIGSGGREHAVTWKIAQSPKVEKIYCAPGNPGMAELGECVDIEVTDSEALLAFAKENKIDITVVGPEVPLVAGITDLFEAEGLKIFGPDKKCAQFEGSKAFTKEFLMKHNIPTGAYKEYTNYETAVADIGLYGFPMVIKADGLAAGKGVLIVDNHLDAKEALKQIMKDKAFGDSGDKVVIEEFLTGREASVLCFVDGNTIVPMESAQDYKRALDGDEGLNTGGMGTYSPNILFDEELTGIIEETILEPIIKGFKADNLNFKGILFIGLMIENNEPKVLEFNVRFGDPEAQSVLMRLETDLVEIIESCLDGTLEDMTIWWKEEVAVCVVLASGGYPNAYKKGMPISGLKDVDDAIVFHAGTKSVDGEIVTNGGRVLGVTATGDTIEEAREIAYRNAEKISFEGVQYRSDIAEI
jgi:phosphoribosylamine--glycine ligase